MTDPTQNITRFYPWEEALPDRHARPNNPFTPFEESDLEKTIPERFQEMVALYPDRLAVKGAQHELTYRALNELANRLAWAILAEGEGRAPMVALLCEHDAPAIAALMGVLKAGRAYVPLDATYPRARIEYILADSQADLIVADHAHLEWAGELAAGASDSKPCRVLNVEALDADLPTENPELELSPLDYAYIIYTSGTTGQPKGVLGNHLQMLHQSLVFVNAHHYCPEDRIGLVASLTFSGSLAYIFPTLLSGAALLPFDVRKEGAARVADWLIRERVTIYGSVPMLFRQMCATLPEGFRFPDLRAIRLGGDRIEKGDLELYKRHTLPNCVFRPGYGATEAKIISQHFMNHESEIEGIVPVGYEVPGFEVLILDRKGQPVQEGEIGEMAVKSRYLAPGYWGRPEATKEKFLPAVEGGDTEPPAERIYLTGDLGRKAPDGCLTHMGRVDSQVKIRGFRIEIAEVEAALLDLDVVERAAVIVRSGPGGEPQLVAYLVPVEQPGPTTTHLRQALGARLPEYMIPALFVTLEEMPLNVNDKIDRRALPDPQTSRPELAVAYEAPRDELERKLVDIWEQVLGVEPVGVRDDFFELGGHSLLGVQLFARIAQETGRKLPVTALLQAPTVELMADALRREDQAAFWSSLVTLTPRQPGNQRPAVFMVHGALGEIVYHRDLARLLGPDQPFYGFQARGLDGKQAPRTRVEGMADHYIEEMRRVQPKGPYILAGYCFGGTVAFEMAQQLRQHPDKPQVALLVLIETSRRPPEGRAARIRTAVDLLMDLKPKDKLGYLWDRSVGRFTTRGAYKKLRAENQKREARIDKPVWTANTRASRRYQPQVYPGRIVLFKISGRSLYNPYLGWKGLAAGGIEVHVIPSTHYEILQEPAVHVLAQKLRACIDQALATVEKE